MSCAGLMLYRSLEPEEPILTYQPLTCIINIWFRHIFIRGIKKLIGKSSFFSGSFIYLDSKKTHLSKTLLLNTYN